MTEQQAKRIQMLLLAILCPILLWFPVWVIDVRRDREHQARVILELERVNNMLELQYFEMEWSDETFEQYCTDNPDDCEVLR